MSRHKTMNINNKQKNVPLIEIAEHKTDSNVIVIKSYSLDKNDLDFLKLIEKQLDVKIETKNCSLSHPPKKVKWYVKIWKFLLAKKINLE